MWLEHIHLWFQGGEVFWSACVSSLKNVVGTRDVQSAFLLQLSEQQEGENGIGYLSHCDGSWQNSTYQS